MVLVGISSVNGLTLVNDDVSIKLQDGTKMMAMLKNKASTNRLAQNTGQSQACKGQGYNLSHSYKDVLVNEQGKSHSGHQKIKVQPTSLTGVLISTVLTMEWPQYMIVITPIPQDPVIHDIPFRHSVNEGGLSHDVSLGAAP